ncbi:MAG: putative glycosyltransferase [Parcubacteria group bacterium Gr01-1014_31]|nr:MAG: putative glycosyltransferase [Parcubacteria group bacterium Gr01-1014_31]
MASPLVSVIIPTYNRPQQAVGAVESFLRQTYRRIEVIVVNDGGTPEVGPAVNALADPRLRFFSKQNGGLASARNYGLRQAQGEYVTFCDDDDDVYPQRLELHLAHMAATGATVSFCNAHVVTADRARPFFRQPPVPSFAGLFYRTNPPPNTFLVLRAAIERVGGFDERLRVCEDLDLWLRLLPQHRFDYLHQPLVRYVRHPGAMSNDLQTMSREISRLTENYVRAHAVELPPEFLQKFRRLMLLRQGKRQLRERDLFGGLTTAYEWIATAWSRPRTPSAS